MLLGSLTPRDNLNFSLSQVILLAKEEFLRTILRRKPSASTSKSNVPDTKRASERVTVRTLVLTEPPDEASEAKS